MIIDVELSDFKIHNDGKWSFAPGINAIVGPGGSGKTSIMEAIGWAVFGALPGKKADFVSIGASDTEYNGFVQLSALIGNDSIDVHKSFGGYSSLYLDDKMVAEGEMATREAVASLLDCKKLDTLFSNLIGITQGSLDHIFTRSTSERVKVFSKILNIDKYKGFSDWLLESSRDLDTKSQITRGELVILDQERARGEESESMYWDLHGKLAELSVEIVRRRDIVESVKKDLDFTNDLDIRILSAETEIDRLSGLLLDRDALICDLDALNEDAHCPTCGQEVDNAKRAEIRQELSHRLDDSDEVQKKISTREASLDFDRRLLFIWKPEVIARRCAAELAKMALLLENESYLRGNMDALSSSHVVDAYKRILAKDAELAALEAASSKLDAIRATSRKLPALIAGEVTAAVTGLATEFVRAIYQNWSIVWNEDFSINVHIGEMTLSFSQLSKSQKSIAALSVVLALAKLVSPTRFVLLDEPFANMDGQQVALVSSAIRDTAWFEQVILTTHRLEVEHIFDNVIEVETEYEEMG